MGLIPMHGGLKEIAMRAADAARGNDILQFFKHSYMHAATAAVLRSALEAQSISYLKLAT